jgi:hypothetical protein
LRSRSKPARPYICRLIILTVDGALDGPGAVRHGQAVDDGGVVALQSGGEGAQSGWVVGADLFDPSVELFAVKTGHHLGEVVTCLPAAARCGQLASTSLSLTCSSGLRLSGWRSIHAVTSRTFGGLTATRGGRRAAGTAAGSHARCRSCPHSRSRGLGEQLRGRAAPVVPPVVQLLLERVQNAWAPVAGDRQQIFDAVGAGEAAHRLGGQAEFAHNCLDAEATRRRGRLARLASTL